MFKILEENCEGIKVGELYQLPNQTNKVDNKANLINYKNRTVHVSYFYGSKSVYSNLMQTFLMLGWTIIYDTMEI